MDPANPNFEALTNNIKELEAQINFLQNGETPLQPQESLIEKNLSTPPQTPIPADHDSYSEVPEDFVFHKDTKDYSLNPPREKINTLRDVQVKLQNVTDEINDTQTSLTEIEEEIGKGEIKLEDTNYASLKAFLDDRKHLKDSLLYNEQQILNEEISYFIQEESKIDQSIQELDNEIQELDKDGALTEDSLNERT
jgi:chaperonin cofactor prefoldin